MLCPLCGQRKARRSCPAVGRQICTVCCGSKRLIEIACPPDCVYLTTAREHPAAAVVRRHQREFGWLVSHMRDLGERQGRLFLVLATFFARDRAADLQAPIDDDAIDACASLAATLETSSKGVIYEHRPSTLAAERLVAAIKPLLEEMASGIPRTMFERDAAVVLRRVEQAAREVHGEPGADRRAFFDLLARIMSRAPGQTGSASEDQPAPANEPSRLILP